MRVSSVLETQPGTGDGSADGGMRAGYAGLMRGYRRFYFVVFYLSVIIETAGFALYHSTFADDPKSAYQTVLIVIQVSPAILASSAFLGYSITEAVKMIADMVMDVIRTRRERNTKKEIDKAIAEARPGIVEEARPQIVEEARPQIVEEARPQILAEGLAEFIDWNRRRMDAAARGEPFDEPFPYSNGEQGNDS